MARPIVKVGIGDLFHAGFDDFLVLDFVEKDHEYFIQVLCLRDMDKYTWDVWGWAAEAWIIASVDEEDEP